jgi:hypothetical protein
MGPMAIKTPELASNTIYSKLRFLKEKSQLSQNTY